MLSSAFVFGLVFLSIGISARSVTEETKQSGTKGHTCLYKGVEYQEGEDLPTHGECFHCTCTKDFVEPSIDQCAIIECPDDWKGDCTPIYEEGQCCPVSWNCSVSSGIVPLVVPYTPGKCNCDWRYFKHYSVKQCEPVYVNGSCCPIRFDCPEKITRDKSFCHFKNKTYNLGDKINDVSQCTECMCIVGDLGHEISCAADGCGVLGRDPQLEDSRCYEVYEEDSCCASGVKCDTGDSFNSSEPICILDGKIYHYGEKMYPKGEPCLYCYCNENWNGVNGKTCHSSDCDIDMQFDSLQEGCIPIYHEATCCPIEYHCKTGEEEVIPSSNSLVTDDQNEKNKCKFDGKSYNIGSILDIEHPTGCVSCSCRTPPDFTCIHKRCPHPPNDDYVNCHPSFIPGECCPTYECIQNSPSTLCDPIKCPESCVTVAYPNGCPVCDCEGLLCAPPKCPVDCTVEYDPATPGSCPTCKCPDDVAAPLDKPVCDPVQCGPQCHKAFGPQGCPMCICGPLCSLPKCDDPGCKVETFVLEGQCPRCVCPDIALLDVAGSMQAPQIRCAPVKCSSYCREVSGPNGCPMCDCGLLCSPPKCEPGCRLEAVPSSGSCPKCVCDPFPQVLQCAPVKCVGNCYEVRVPNGCPMCKCDDVVCSPPKCPRGCQISRDNYPGKCPDCVCPPTIPTKKPVCDDVKCGPQCHQGINSEGCPMCICGPLCSPPKCDAGCYIQKRVPQGQCPGCECPGSDVKPNQDVLVRCGAVMCPHICKEAFGENGCPTCVCELCSPVKCESGCRLQHTSPYSPCPECVCDKLPEVVQCSPPKCDDDPNCQLDNTAWPCPQCVCTIKDKELPDILCSPPKCDEPGCRIDFSAKPCPSCVCDDRQVVPDILCSPPKCDEPNCRVDYNTKPCPSCVCNDRRIPAPRCSPPKCDYPGCRINYSSRPCPECVCDGGLDQALSDISCSPPKCDEPGCRVDYNAKPCPTCVCDDKLVNPIRCTPPLCHRPGCRIDESTEPCPSCVCDTQQVQNLACSPPRCNAPGCRIDYSTRPCPACVCDNKLEVPPIPCSPPKCDEPGCRMDYTAFPCPQCVCDGPKIECAMPNCNQQGCWINYHAKPCPECVCNSDYVPFIECSIPKCDFGCEIDYTAKPCPACVCSNRTARQIQCSPPRCPRGCSIDYSSRPCPSCACNNGRIDRQISCDPPRCPRGCRIDYTSSPCPSCACSSDRINQQVRCDPPRCGAGCEIDYATRPCPSCKCGGGFPRPGQGGGIGIRCTTPICKPGCWLDTSVLPCSECKCDEERVGSGIRCVPPVCAPGCWVDSSMTPCPDCKCNDNHGPW